MEADLGVVQQSGIWKRAFVEDTEDDNVKARELLSNEFGKVRTRAKALVAQISADIPGLTIHDITHLDALWETASLILAEDIFLNPLETFILGCAILFHDAGMCVAAYPNGLEDLKDTTEWQDALARHYSSIGVDRPTVQQLNSPSSDVVAGVAPVVLRLLHAKQAAEIAITGWSDPSNSSNTLYLISNDELRNSFGELIGKIAESHWWDVHKLDRLPERTGSDCGLPPEWVVRPQLIACVLRVADATQIDSRRASGFLRALLKPTGVSHLHWDFQSRLSYPVLDGEYLVYNSTREFEVHEAKSWWLCFDTLSMINEELSSIDNFLDYQNLPRLAARKVKGIVSPQVLSRDFVRTKGWKPVDSRLRVTDASHVAKMLGGKQLYGDDPKVALRELLQNAMDAVRARRKLESRDENWGEILVSVENRGEDSFLVIKDNGIGMSAHVLSTVLVDFGRSLWMSDDLLREHPGLSSLHAKHSGKFGIGFFSVFMLGAEVSITSRKYDFSSDANTLEFSDGLEGNPLLRELTSGERKDLLDYNTVVKVKLDNKPDSEGGILFCGNGFRSLEALTLEHLIGRVAPASEVNIKCFESGEEKLVITANDWKNISDAELNVRLHRDGDFEGLAYYPLVSGDGELLGRIRINDSHFVFGRGRLVASVDGLSSPVSDSVLRSVLEGIIVASTDVATRANASFSGHDEVLLAWAEDKVKKISDSPNIGINQKYKLATQIVQLGAETLGLPVFRSADSKVCFSVEEFIAYLVEKKPTRFIFAHDVHENTDDEISNSDFGNANYNEDVFEPFHDGVEFVVDLVNARLGEKLKSLDFNFYEIVVGETGEGFEIFKDCEVLELDWA